MTDENPTTAWREEIRELEQKLENNKLSEKEERELQWRLRDLRFSCVLWRSMDDWGLE